jgi:hypothetical protein
MLDSELDEPRAPSPFDSGEGPAPPGMEPLIIDPATSGPVVVGRTDELSLPPPGSFPSGEAEVAGPSPVAPRGDGPLSPPPSTDSDLAAVRPGDDDDGGDDELPAVQGQPLEDDYVYSTQAPTRSRAPRLLAAAAALCGAAYVGYAFLGGAELLERLTGTPEPIVLVADAGPTPETAVADAGAGAALAVGAADAGAADAGAVGSGALAGSADAGAADAGALAQAPDAGADSADAGALAAANATDAGAADAQPAQPKTVNVRFDSKPPGATVSVADVDLGETPLETELPLVEGPQAVSFERDGYKGQTKSVKLVDGARLSVTLTPDKAERAEKRKPPKKRPPRPPREPKEPKPPKETKPPDEPDSLKDGALVNPFKKKK